MNRNALEQLVLQPPEENEKLKEENAYLKFKLEELQAKRYKSNKKKPPDDTSQEGLISKIVSKTSASRIPTREYLNASPIVSKGTRTKSLPFYM